MMLGSGPQDIKKTCLRGHDSGQSPRIVFFFKVGVRYGCGGQGPYENNMLSSWFL